MPDNRDLSFPGGMAYAGSNAYAYAYSGANAYAYSAPASSGIVGFAGDPMLSAAVISTRDALLAAGDLTLLGEAGDRRAGRSFVESADDGLPTGECARDLLGYGGQVRSAIGLFELLTSVNFRIEDGVPSLRGISAVEGKPAWNVVATLVRPNRDYFEGQLSQIDSWASRRDVRAAEILTQIAPPLGFFASLLNLQAGRHPRTLELVNVALQFTYSITMRFKHALACPRPSEYSVGVQAMIEVPMHPSMPAGHAAEAHVTAAVLGALASAAPGSKTDTMLRRLAHRIAENRVVAGLHFPVDLLSGRLLGDALSSFFLARCGQQADWTGGAFKVAEPDNANGKSDEFSDGLEAVVTRFHSGPRGCCSAIAAVDGVASDVLQEMWAEAAGEWKRRPTP